MPRTKEQIKEYLRGYYVKHRDLIKARSKAWRLKNPEWALRTRKKWLFKNREYYLRFKRELNAKERSWLDEIKTVPCIDCGYAYPPECMDFDHVRGRKRFNVGMNRGRKRTVVLREIKKCDIVCSNCHRIRTKTRKYYNSIKIKE